MQRKKLVDYLRNNPWTQKFGASTKAIMEFRKTYNALCEKCRVKIMLVQQQNLSNPQKASDETKNLFESGQFCEKCQAVIEKRMGKVKDIVEK